MLRCTLHFLWTLHDKQSNSLQYLTGFNDKFTWRPHDINNKREASAVLSLLRYKYTDYGNRWCLWLCLPCTRRSSQPPTCQCDRLGRWVVKRQRELAACVFDCWGRYHGGRRPSSDDSPTVIPPSALDKPSIMKRCHRRRTCSHTSPRRSPTMVTLHDTRFVGCRWWNDGWIVKTIVTGRSSASIIPAPGL